MVADALGTTIAQVGDSVPPMDIDEFYEADPGRRASAELELGSEWLDKDGVRHELNYVEDTGELYVLREPQPHVREDPFGGIHVTDPPGYENKITVHVIAKIPTAGVGFVCNFAMRRFFLFTAFKGRPTAEPDG